MIIKVIIILLTSILVTSGLSPSDNQIREPEKEIFRLINKFRKSKGLPRLRYLKSQQRWVDEWAKHISERFEHANSAFTCENIAYNYESPQELFYQWRDSPGHRRNMLSPRIKYCAVGVYQCHRASFGVFRGYRNRN